MVNRVRVGSIGKGWWVTGAPMPTIVVSEDAELVAARPPWNSSMRPIDRQQTTAQVSMWQGCAPEGSSFEIFVLLIYLQEEVV